MKKIILMACISALTVTYSINTHAKIYKWTDSKGHVHYSATPPAIDKKVKHKAKNIEDEIQLAAGKHRPAQTSKQNNSDKTKSKETQDGKESDSTLSPPDKKLLDYCKSQKNNLNSLKSNFRNVWIDATGKKTKLDQQQRQEKVDYLKERIKKDCHEVET